MIKKYGFVYLWFDRKHKRYYIGCRWGYEDDGYVCSSPWMKQGYKHRPNDFKRRILSRVYTNKKDLLEAEYSWLSKIKKEELGKRYYNLHNHHFGHWSSDQYSRMTIGQKIAASPDRAKNIGLANKGKKPAQSTIDATIAVRLGKTYEEIYGSNEADRIRRQQSERHKGRKHSDEAKKKMSDAAKSRPAGRKASAETKRKMSESHKRRYVEMKANNEEKCI